MKNQVSETGEVVTMQLSLAAGFDGKNDIKSLVLVLDAKDPTQTVVF